MSITANKLGLSISKLMVNNRNKKILEYMKSNNIPINLKLNNAYMNKMNKEDSRVLSDSFIESVKVLLVNEGHNIEDMELIK